MSAPEFNKWIGSKKSCCHCKRPPAMAVRWGGKGGSQYAFVCNDGAGEIWERIKEYVSSNTMHFTCLPVNRADELMNGKKGV